MKKKIAVNYGDYIKVGEIKIGRGIKGGNILVSNNQLVHIMAKHGLEIEKVGFSVLQFIKTICSDYNQIRSTRDGYILVVYSEHLSKIAIIEINLSLDGFWEIKTAGPRSSSTIEKKALVWDSAKRYPSGNGNRSN